MISFSCTRPFLSACRSYQWLPLLSKYRIDPHTNGGPEVAKLNNSPWAELDRHLWAPSCPSRHYHFTDLGTRPVGLRGVLLEILGPGVL